MPTKRKQSGGARTAGVDERVCGSTLKRRVIEAVARAHWRTVKALLARETEEPIGDGGH
jgi:hypothetical protein